MYLGALKGFELFNSALSCGRDYVFSMDSTSQMRFHVSRDENRQTKHKYLGSDNINQHSNAASSDLINSYSNTV